ncbi:MAG: ABC transporter ATP-binding protein [Verrucomicrobiota bacterium]
MGEPVLHARGLVKTFGGVVALNGLHLQVGRGEVMALVGRNGAGKTTAMRILLGLTRADAGTAHILGKDWWEAGAADRQRVAYVSQQGQPPGWMTLGEMGRMSARFFARWDSGLARELAGRWEVPWNRPLGRLSGGHQRLAALAWALATRAELLLLDEPAAGLDPVSRRDVMRGLVDALMRTEGCTVLLNTHVLADVERLATHVAVLQQGSVVATAAVEEWQRTMRRVQVVVPGQEVPPGLEVPGTLRSHRSGPVLTALARVTDDAQLAPVRALPGVRVHVFPLTMEEWFVAWMEPGEALANRGLEL